LIVDWYHSLEKVVVKNKSFSSADKEYKSGDSITVMPKARVEVSSLNDK
jgi:hypothetical protein